MSRPASGSEDSIARAKHAAAEGVIEHFVRSGMRLGLGSGSTADLFIEALGVRVTEGLQISCVASSEASLQLAMRCGVPVRPLDGLTPLDLAVDGADEIDSAFQAIKGGGGCHLRERQVARSAGYVVLIVDESKCVDRLGAFPLPLEIEPSGRHSAVACVERVLSVCGYDKVGVVQRMQADGAETPFITDNGNFIFDAALGVIMDAVALAAQLDSITGLVAHGLFLEEVDALIVGCREGSHRLRTRPGRTLKAKALA